MIKTRTSRVDEVAQYVRFVVVNELCSLISLCVNDFRQQTALTEINLCTFVLKVFA